MNYDSTKEEILLDEALNNTPNFNVTDEEIKNLLSAGKKFAEAVETKAARAGLSKLLQKLPSKKSNSLFNNFLNYMTMPKIFALKPIGTIVAVVLFAIGGIQIIQNATVQPSGVSGGSVGTASSLLQTSGDKMLYGEAVGYETPMNQAKSEGRDLSAPYTSDDERAIAPGMPYPVPPDYYGPGDIRDTREYLKTSYYANLKTRHPNTLAERAQITVRGLGGRVDNAQISEENSYVAFALPKNKFEAFRTEIKTFVGAKFITENISSENLLPQKQNLEENTESNQNNLNAQNEYKIQITNIHKSLVNNLNASLAKFNKSIASLNDEAKNTNDSLRLAAINNEKAQIEKSIRDIRNRLNAENDKYNRELASVNNQIEYLKSNLKNLAKEDVALGANVETVQGSLSFSKITYFQMINQYLDGYLSALIFIVVGLVIFLAVRRRPPAPEIQPVQ